jgi:hypothetical protein
MMQSYRARSPGDLEFGVKGVRSRYKTQDDMADNDDNDKRKLYRSKSVLGSAVRELDLIGLQVGRMLRTRPNWRLVVILYVTFLHLWVIYVLYHFSQHN